MDDARTQFAASTDPNSIVGGLPALVKANLRYVDELNWFDPSDLRFVEEISRGTRESIFVFEYVPTQRHLFLDGRGRTYQLTPGADPTKLASAFRLHNPHPCGVADLRPELPNSWRNDRWGNDRYSNDRYGVDRYRSEPWNSFAAAPSLTLVDDHSDAEAGVASWLERGEELVVTRNGVAIGELVALRAWR